MILCRTRAPRCKASFGPNLASGASVGPDRREGAGGPAILTRGLPGELRKEVVLFDMLRAWAAGVGEATGHPARSTPMMRIDIDAVRTDRV